MVIDTYRNAIAEPARLAACPPLIRALGQASRRAREVVVDAAGVRRERMPIGVIVSSYFLRAGHVLPTTILDVVYRNGPSTIASLGDGPQPFRPAPSKPAVRRRPRPSSGRTE